jgi:hypothetical protein
MALKKSELYSSLWSSCDELRGGMDRFMPKWQFYIDQLNRLPVSHEDWDY